MPVSVTVSGTPALRLAQEELGGAAGAAEHVDEPHRDALRAGARAPRTR